MDYTIRKGYTFSKLALGTVQLGMDYGITNLAGQPSVETANDVIHAALKAGVTTIDTSIAYGSSEELIGEFFDSEQQRTAPTIVSKFKVSRRAAGDLNILRQEVASSIQRSLEKLKLEKLPVYLLHTDKDQQLEHLINPITIVLKELKDQDLIGIAGISVYSPADIDFVLNNEIFEATQIPLNIFDHRLINNGKLAQLQAQNKIVFARSIFLQGIFFMKPDQLPGTLQNAKGYLQDLTEISKLEGVTVPQLSFSFVKSLPGVTSIIFGAVNAEQVHQNVSLLEVRPITQENFNHIRDKFANVPEEIITPGKWQ